MNEWTNQIKSRKSDGALYSKRRRLITIIIANACGTHGWEMESKLDAELNATQRSRSVNAMQEIEFDRT